MALLLGSSDNYTFFASVFMVLLDLLKRGKSLFSRGGKYIAPFQSESLHDPSYT